MLLSAHSIQLSCVFTYCMLLSFFSSFSGPYAGLRLAAPLFRPAQAAWTRFQLLHVEISRQPVGAERCVLYATRARSYSQSSNLKVARVDPTRPQATNPAGRPSSWGCSVLSPCVTCNYVCTCFLPSPLNSPIFRALLCCASASLFTLSPGGLYVST